jgi:hypothetical protein
MSDLERLARPFPASMIQSKPGKFAASYVAHSEVVQKLLSVVGPFDFAVTEIVRGPSGKIEGCLASMTVTIDERVTTIVEVGDCERPDNWPTDGARLKDAASDALKRCAMRLGVGLHLWAQENFVLADQLKKSEERLDNPA